MILNIVICFFMGYPMLIAFLYCVPMDEFLESTLSFPFITAFQNITLLTAAATAMVRLIFDELENMVLN